MGATAVRSPFESPEVFASIAYRLAAIVAIPGLFGLVDRLVALPLAALLALFGVLARLAGQDRDAAPAQPAAEPATIPPSTATTVRRTFRLPSSIGAERVALVGEFNGWSSTAHPLRRDGDWFTVDVALPPGRSYRYRFLLDGARWENDWAADDYVPNAFGTDDSVVRVDHPI